MMHVQILGSRGVPSRHGGFETFAQDLSLYLVERGHRVTVYCQEGPGETASEDVWNGVRRIHIPASEGAKGTVAFDWKCVLHSIREPGIALTLGYNTAVFSLLYRLTGHKNVMNMDGLEWKREKWSPTAKAWLMLNEWLGARFAHHLIADHPVIAEHLEAHTRVSRISVIPYGSEPMGDVDPTPLQQFGLQPKSYYLLIARPEPENSILEIVKGFSVRSRNAPLVVLGTYDPDRLPYHSAVLKEAGPDIRFLGAIYDRPVVAALRRFAKAYIHGHRVGGTNPSLVEALAAGNPIIAHANVFTRWVAGDAGIYFKSAEEIDAVIERLEVDPALLNQMETASLKRHQAAFSQLLALSRYEELLQRFAPALPAEDGAGMARNHRATGGQRGL
jgi:glycosyltransferase involved in cell wall biosynthesis